MKRFFILAAFITCTAVINSGVKAQCSVCTKTASQMGEKPAKGMNSGILYLMAAPFAIVGYIGYRWWKSNGQ
jgi:TRAP-type C4-dicarboxylate transport system permease small subunit